MDQTEERGFSPRQWRTLETFDRDTREALRAYHYGVMRSAERDRRRRKVAMFVISTITTVLVVMLLSYVFMWGGR